MKNACSNLVSIIYFLTPSAFAAEPTKEGSYDFTRCLVRN